MKNSEIKKEIIEKLFPEPLPAPDEIEKKYPPRNLGEGAMVTRIAPSPTGFMHIGSLYASLISERLAHQTGGVFYLRIEDTDKKREVAGAAELIVRSLEHYMIRTDEGKTVSGNEVGEYGPYKQSERINIYKAYVKYLVGKEMAYPCFCTGDDLENMRKEQEALGIRPGYYKQWAKWRHASDQEALDGFNQGKEFVVRFRSNGDFNRKINANDILLGARELPENDQDIVIMKSDGLPTYHMAHVIDDHLMGTTHVIRGNEWFSSLPLHLQLFETMGWAPPQYGHIFPIQKMEGTSKRKLSKRKDPEANVDYYNEQGYPEESVIEYLLNLANSDFEDWRKGNPDKNNREFRLTLERLASSNGPLFDFNKLNDVSKEIIARYSAKEACEKIMAWAKQYDQSFYELIKENIAYAEKILDIERNNASKSRKDIGKWSDAKYEMGYFFDDCFSISKRDALHLLEEINPESINAVISSFTGSYDEKDTQDLWFAKIKEIARANGYAQSTKEFKQNPGAYKGNVADIAKIFRVLLTGRAQTPDLYSIMQVMGKDRVFRRLSLLSLS